MAVAFRAAGTLGESTLGIPTINYPAGVAAGDLLVIQFTCATTVTPTTPSGWTKLFGPTTMAGGTNMYAYVYYKIAGGSEPSSILFTRTGANSNAGGIMVAYTGADPTTPVDVSATAVLPTSGTSGTTPSVTTTKANTMLLRMYWNYSNTATIVPAGTDTERYDTFYGAPFIGLELADSTQAAAGASGTTTATYSTATSGGVGATIAVAPVAGPSVADFTGTPLSGVEPLSVAFTDTSTNTPTSWAWDFGDGGTSSSQNPSHSYAAAGSYTVTLIATNSAGSDTKTRTGYVVVSDQPRPVRINTSQGWADIGDATSFVSGSGAPTVAAGATGAIYLDTVSHRIYGPKAAGAWPSTPLGVLVPDYTGVTNGWSLKIVGGVPAWSA